MNFPTIITELFLLQNFIYSLTNVKLAGQLEKIKSFKNMIERLNLINIYMRPPPPPKNIKNIYHKLESQTNVSICPANFTPVFNAALAARLEIYNIPFTSFELLEILNNQ